MKFLFMLLFFPLTLWSAESVFCLHGFMRKATSMKGMERAMEREGYHVHNWGYPSREKTIEQHAEALVVDLKEMSGANPDEPIHFITHSMGGIIVRSALNHPDCPDEAKRGRAVLLSPPNQGSRFGRTLGKVGPISKILGNKAGHQILSSHGFQQLGEFPPTLEVLVISGTFGFNPFAKGVNDGKVGVTESCLCTPHKHWTHFSGHSWIMYNDQVIYKARDFISEKASDTCNRRCGHCIER